MKKEILLLSSLISFALVFYLGIPNKNITGEVESKVDKKSTFTSPSVDESVNDDVPLKFDIVRLDPSGDLIIAGKTKPNIIVKFMMVIKNLLPYFQILMVIGSGSVKKKLIMV